MSDIILWDSTGYEKSLSWNHYWIKDIKIKGEKMIAGNITKDKLSDLSKLADIVDVSGALETNKVKDIKKIEDFVTYVKKLIMKIKKGIQLIDQHDKNFMYGGKFGGNFIPETLKKPIDDLTKLFAKLRKDKKFLNERDYYFNTYVGAPTPFIKLENLTEHLGGAQIYAKVVSEANGGAHKIYNATVHCLIAKRARKKFIVGDTGAGYAGKMLSMAAKNLDSNVKFLWVQKTLKDNGQM